MVARKKSGRPSRVVSLGSTFVCANLLLIAHPQLAQAQDTSCYTRYHEEQSAPFPGYPSSNTIGSVYSPGMQRNVPLRLGFYCSPPGGSSNPILEFNDGFGFGKDKLYHRHNIGRYSSDENLIKALKFVFSAPQPSVRQDQYGAVYTHNVWVYQRDCDWDEYGAAYCPSDVDTETLVRGVALASSPSLYYRMPVWKEEDTNSTLGVLTVYCDYYDGVNEYTKYELECEDWITNALIGGANKYGL